MTLLIDKTCKHCRNIEEIASFHSEIIKLYVSNGMIQLDDGKEHPLDKKIPALPALIVGEEENCVVYCGEKYISDFLNKISQENK
jgi:hypothetical protein